MRPKYDITNKIKLHRLLAGDMTQEELAARTGVTRQTILSIEKGRYNPSVGLALLISKELGVAIEKLFTLKEDDDNGQSA
jgi:putative transcriptional regulator